MMAKTAADRMREFRQRKAQHEGLKYTEVYIPKRSIDDAAGIAAGEGIPLREVLTRAVTRGLELEQGKVDVSAALVAVLDALDLTTLQAIDREADAAGKFKDLAFFESLILDGIAARQASRSTPKPKRGRPAKEKPEA